MSKLMAGTAFVFLSGATVTGGVLLFGKNGKTNENAEEQIDYELPTTNFKDGVHQEGCVTKLFGAQEKFATNLTDLNDSDSGSSAPDSFFPQNKPTSGCLVVNWDKKEKESKWSGNFRFLWAVAGESKGFVVFLVGTSQKAGTGNEHKVSWSGTGYLMEAEIKDDTTIWKPKKKTDSKNDVSTSKEASDASKFPKSNTILKPDSETSELPDFWGWITGTGDLASIVNESELSGGSDSSLRAYWDWSGVHKETPATNKKLIDWTKNFDTWWDVMFDKSKFKVNDVSNKQEGTWTNRHYKKVSASEGTTK